VTPITYWGPSNNQGTNIWPALLWNQVGSVQMPIERSPSYDSQWGDPVKTTKLFECPADEEVKKLDVQGSKMPRFSYGISRSAAFKVTNGTNDTIKVGPEARVTKFRHPSQMIYVCDTSWSCTREGAVGFQRELGRLYSTKQVSDMSFCSGSVVHAADQQILGYESAYSSDAKERLEKSTQPWHVSKSWNYSFIDGHAQNYRPEQTHCHNGNVTEPGTYADVEKRTPNGMWTWDHTDWGGSGKNY
jgi:hypothetical protein